MGGWLYATNSPLWALLSIIHPVLSSLFCFIFFWSVLTAPDAAFFFLSSDHLPNEGHDLRTIDNIGTRAACPVHLVHLPHEDYRHVKSNMYEVQNKVAPGKGGFKEHKAMGRRGGAAPSGATLPPASICALPVTFTAPRSLRWPTARDT